jgi:hypothetical protein
MPCFHHVLIHFFSVTTIKISLDLLNQSEAEATTPKAKIYLKYFEKH